MLETLPIILGLPALLIWPVWRYANHRRPSTPLIMFLGVPGIALWFLLMILDIGHESRNLLYEPLGISMIAVMLAYWKLMKLERSNPKNAGKTVIVLLLLATLTIRLTMPGQ